MKKLITIMLLGLMANVLTAANAGYNVGYNSKLIEQGTVTGTSLVTAGANVEVGSFGFAVDTLSSFDNSQNGFFKRVNLTASYKFTSTLADVTFGGTYKHASKVFALGDVKNNTVPFITIGGNLFTKLPWHVTASIDSKNDINNFEGNLELPFPVGLGKLKVVPIVGVGINDISINADDLNKNGLQALNDTDKYYQGTLAVSYPTFLGELRGGTYVQSSGFSSDSKRLYGWYTSINNKF
jgi:hypothetical protein